MAVPRPVGVIGVAVRTSPHQDSRSFWIRQKRQSLISRLDTSMPRGPNLFNNHGYGYQRHN